MSEKILNVISYMLNNEYVEPKMLVEKFGFTNRTARRYINIINDIRFEIGFIDCCMEGTGTAYDPKKIKVKLNNKYIQ